MLPVAELLRGGEILTDSCTYGRLLLSSADTMPGRRLTAAAVLAIFLATTGCPVVRHPVEVDPAATFAAHQEHAELAVDRLERGRVGRLVPASWLRRPGA